jgi:hypothetical protein
MGNTYGWINTGSSGNWIIGRGATGTDPMSGSVHIHSGDFTRTLIINETNNKSGINISSKNDSIAIRSNFPLNGNGDSDAASTIFLYANQGSIRLKATDMSSAGSSNVAGRIVLNASKI